MLRYRLHAPGPTPVPERVLTRMAGPIVHHRTPAFSKLFHDVREGLKWLYQTQNDVIILAASGTGAMEAAVINLVNPGEKALCINGGKFGERWGKICKANGIAVTEIKVPWGQAVNPAQVAEELKKGDYRIVCGTASETSTAVTHPIKEIGDVIATHSNCYFVVDAITALGVVPLPMEACKIDILVTGSQKALMLPPGLAFAGVSERAWKRMEDVKTPRFYFNLLIERKNLHKDTTAWTPAVSLVTGLHEVLAMMKEEGLENIFKRHALMAEATREAAKASGLKLYAPEAPSTAVTAVWMPEVNGTMLDGKKFVKILRDTYNITIAGGQDEAEGKIFRIGHLGYYDSFDILTVWSAVELALKDMGYPAPLGKGVSRLMEVIHGRIA